MRQLILEELDIHINDNFIVDDDFKDVEKKFVDIKLCNHDL